MMAGTLAAYRNPARSSPGARGTGGTGCSSARLRNSSEAMTKPKLTALATKHQPIPAVLTSTAATVGPATRATLTSVLLSTTALRTSPGPTTSAVNVCRAGLSTALKVPKTRASATTCHSRTLPVSTSRPRAGERLPQAGRELGAQHPPPAREPVHQQTGVGGEGQHRKVAGRRGQAEDG